jgi:hypothetical protein
MGFPRAVQMRLTLTRSLLALSATVAVTGGATAGSASPGGTVTLRADLDGDGVPELIQVIENKGANPYGGTAPISVSYVRVIDGATRRVQQVSPKAEQMRVRLVRPYITDRRPDVWYQGSLGNAGSVYMGLVSWDNGRPHVLWRYSAVKPGARLKNAWSGAKATLVDDLTANGRGFEIRLEEGVLAPGDAMCCPSHTRISLYRFNRSRYTLFRRMLAER